MSDVLHTHTNTPTYTNLVKIQEYSMNQPPECIKSPFHIFQEQNKALDKLKRLAHCGQRMIDEDFGGKK